MNSPTSYAGIPEASETQLTSLSQVAGRSLRYSAWWEMDLARNNIIKVEPRAAGSNTHTLLFGEGDKSKVSPSNQEIAERGEVYIRSSMMGMGLEFLPEVARVYRIESDGEKVIGYALETATPTKRQDYLDRVFGDLIAMTNGEPTKRRGILRRPILSGEAEYLVASLEAVIRAEARYDD